MKSRIHWIWSLGLALAVLPFLVADTQETLSQATDNATAAVEPTNSTSPLLTVTNAVPGLKPEAATAAAASATPPPAPPEGNAPAAPMAESPTPDELVNAPVTPVAAEKPLPTNVKLTAPTTEVVKLANSGVDENVMLAFVTNSISTFNLGAEDIIYLNDIGVPGTVVTAMIQRDQAIKQLSANAAPAPAAPPPAEQAAAPAPEEAAAQPAPPAETYVAPETAAYPVFYDSLAPYGTWIDVGGYGLCWQPTVVVAYPGWRPYCHGGRWVYTDCGWYWTSNYSWGWAPFHYGRWFCHAQRGWCWAPGNVWGPAWVSWRYNGSYCGWAPLPPAAGFTVGVGLTYHGQHVSSSFAFGLGVGAYSFVAVSDFNNHHLDRHAVPRQHATQVYHQTTAFTSFDGSHSRIVNQGIPPSHVASATRTQIRPLSIREVTTPTAVGDRRERFDYNSRNLVVYRPRVSPSASTSLSPATRSQQTPGRSSWSEPSQNPSRSAFTPVAPTVAPTSSRPSGGPAAMPASPSRSSSGTAPARSNPSSRSRGGNQSSLADPSPTAAPLTAPAPTVARSTSAPAPKPAAPLVLRGSDRSRQSVGRSGTAATSPSAPSSSFAVGGRRETSQRQSASPAPAPITETRRSQPAAPEQNIISRPSTRPSSQTFRIAEAPAQVPSQTYWSTPRAAAPPPRNDQPRSFSSPPSYSAPSPAQSHSAPSSSSSVRTDNSSSQPSRSSFASPSGRSSSGSGKNQR